jgi:hypothetical protein|tara:strand:+ start:2282 stop:3289 length:1008 start_codon:yes stop_codon:yes gene_type:complete
MTRRTKNHETKNMETERKQDVEDFLAKAPEAVAKILGLNNERVIEPEPKYDNTQNEHVIKGNNNSWIVMGRDRPASRSSGYGGQGATQAGSIDIVVGRGSSQSGGPSDNILGPNFFGDAARIHISQKTNIDRNFGLEAGKIGRKEGTSGIGIKADDVRVVGRQGVKIVTGKGTGVSSGAGGEKNALGHSPAEPAPGIEFIAGNNTNPHKHFSMEKGNFEINTLQPLVMGDNMVEGMKEMVDLINQLQGSIVNFAIYQQAFNANLMLHTHQGVGVGAIQTFPSIELLVAGPINIVNMMTDVHSPLWAQKVNTMFYEVNFLEPYGLQYICSRNVRTT